MADLDNLQCAVPGCDHTSHDGLWLHSRCHPANGVKVLYRFGLLHVTCQTCDRYVTDIQVASEAQPRG